MDPKPSSISSSADSDRSLKLAVAIAIAFFRRKELHQQKLSSDPDADRHRWKMKAKERKRELQLLREEIKQLEDGMPCEVVSQIVSCRCHFFDGIGGLSSRLGRLGGSDESGGQDHWIDDVLRRRFLRLVRQKERMRKLDGSARKRPFAEFDNEDEIDRLSASIDFLVELTNTIVVEDASFATLSHQAVGFILATLKNLLSPQKDLELIEEIVNGLIMRLTRRMCTTTIPKDDELFTSGSEAQFYVQHLIRKLGNEPFIGQRLMLSVSQRISIQAESLLFMDPFDEAFPDMHGSLYMMIQLLEFSILDYVRIWMSTEDFDLKLFEEWVRSVLRARKSLELLECRNGLYMLYMDRVTGELAKQVGPLVRHGKLDQDILSNLFC